MDGRTGQSGACATKTESSIAAVIVRCTIQSHPSASETAHSTKTACTMKFPVGAALRHRAKMGQARKAGFSQEELMSVNIDCNFQSCLGGLDTY